MKFWSGAIMTNPLVEVVEGVGRLESIREPEKVWQVKYHFEVTSTYSRKSVGSVGLRSERKWSEGTVASVDGTTIPQGEYRLHAQDEEILRVDYFDVWSIVPDAA
jgi:hypothetical protein